MHKPMNILMRKCTSQNLSLTLLLDTTNLCLRMIMCPNMSLFLKMNPFLNEPLSEDENVPEYEPETPSKDSADDYTVDMTNVELEPQQAAASTTSVNQRMPNLNTHEKALTALQQDVQHVRNELHTLQMHFFDFIDTVNAQFDKVFKHIYSNVNNNRRG